MTAVLRPQLVPRGLAPQFWFPHLAPYRHLALALLGIGRSGVMAPPLGIKSKIMSSWSSLICLLPIFCLFHLHLARRKTHKTCRYVQQFEPNIEPNIWNVPFINRQSQRNANVTLLGSWMVIDHPLSRPTVLKENNINQSLKLESSFHFFLNFNWCCNL